LDNKTRIGIAAGAAALLLLGEVPAQSPAVSTAASQPGTKLPRAMRKVLATRKLEPAAVGEFGGPLPGLTAAEMELFVDGFDEFQNEDSVASGLGPVFNDVSCVACHAAPAVGGTSTKFVTRFGTKYDGVYDAMADLGGSLLQSQAIHPDALEIGRAHV
jgi:hypothetical protein